MCHANQVAFLNSWGLGCHLHPLIGCALHILCFGPFACSALCVWLVMEFCHTQCLLSLLIALGVGIWPPEGSLCHSVPHFLSVWCWHFAARGHPLSLRPLLSISLFLSLWCWHLAPREEEPGGQRLLVVATSKALRESR